MCKIEDCDEESHYKELDLCKACYSGLAYWAGRPVADKRERLIKIKRLDSRMQFMIDNRAAKVGTIVHFPKRTEDRKKSAKKRRRS